MTVERILLLATLPLPGLVRPRQARGLAPERAVALYDALVREALAALDATGVPLTVCHAPVAPLDAYRDWLGRERGFQLQEGEDPGERMAHALAKAFAAGAERALLLAGGVPGVSPGALRAALDALHDHGAVLAPDGNTGCSLVGFARPALRPEIVQAIPWGRSGALAAARRALEGQGLAVALLPPFPAPPHAGVREAPHCRRLASPGALAYTWAHPQGDTTMIDRKPEREITDPEELDRVLHKAQVLRLGMCREDGPYVVPMSFGIGQGCLYLHSSQKGRKTETLRANPRVCFEMDTDTALIESDGPCGYTMKFRSIVGYGRVVFLQTPEDKLAGLKAIMAHYSETAWADDAFNPKILDKTLVMRLDIESMRGAKHGWNGPA